MVFDKFITINYDITVLILGIQYLSIYRISERTTKESFTLPRSTGEYGANWSQRSSFSDTHAGVFSNLIDCFILTANCLKNIFYKTITIQCNTFVFSIVSDVQSFAVCSGSCMGRNIAYSSRSG